MVVVGLYCPAVPQPGQPGKDPASVPGFNFFAESWLESYRFLILNHFPSASYQSTPKETWGVLCRSYKDHSNTSPLIQLFFIFFSF